MCNVENKMWDSGYMADIDNLAEINENFDTVKTLLNSIRAQGILNTSDVDKLLSGINAKLEKINTDEDIDLIKNLYFHFHMFPFHHE